MGRAMKAKQICLRELRPYLYYYYSHYQFVLQ